MPTQPNLKVPDPGPRVTFTTSDHDDAARIESVLVALGFDAKRVVPDEEYFDNEVLDRAVERLRRTYNLSKVEVTLVWGLLNDLNDDELASAQGGKSMLKWVARSLFAKTGLSNGDYKNLAGLVESLKDLRGDSDA